MTPAEMREAAALVERWRGGVDARADLAAAIRALPLPEETATFEAARAWVLDTLRAEGWDVVEEGEGDG